MCKAGTEVASDKVIKPVRGTNSNALRQHCWEEKHGGSKERPFEVKIRYWLELVVFMVEKLPIRAS